MELSPGRVWCTRFTYETIPEEEGFFEAHKDFLDIHLMLAGRERVLLAPPSQLEMFRCEPDNDFYAYRGQSWHQVVLSPGDFLVVFPDDAHDIKLRLDRPETVTKAVFKVKIK